MSIFQTLVFVGPMLALAIVALIGHQMKRYKERRARRAEETERDE